MEAAELRGIALFDGLDDAQIAELARVGQEHRFAPGEELWHEGGLADVWWVMIEGEVSLVRQVGREETVLGTMRMPGQWAGGFQAWDDSGVYFATGRATTNGRVFTVTATDLRDLSHAWFSFGVHFIEGLVNTVRRVEAMARQREALVALGTLAAGLAHEINNPASAATRAVDSLHEVSETLIASLGSLARGPISAEQFVGLDALRQRLQSSPELDPMDVVDREEALSDWLTDHDVTREWLIAPALAAAGADVSWCEDMASVLADGPLEAGMEWVASSLSMSDLLQEARESTGRVTDLVAAVKSYSQLDRASLQMTDITEGLESTLVMLAHKLPDGVTVVRDYSPDVPPIEAMAGELNQVWTNLIDNAVDAMEDAGTLRVSTRVDDSGWVEVQIADTGPGMPLDVQARAFEPFFTTKGVGRGTGLGLDISRRIVVERHAGEITIDSTPGHTVMKVRLPRRHSSPQET